MKTKSGLNVKFQNKKEKERKGKFLNINWLYSPNIKQKTLWEKIEIEIKLIYTCPKKSICGAVWITNV